METLTTRVEHSRSLEQAERLRAIQTLTELGMLIPVSELETYHGRVKKTEEEDSWSVDPAFKNGSNDSGHFNKNARPTLYTSDKATAEGFAQERAKEIDYRLFNAMFIQQIKCYTPEQRQEWLERKNTKRHAWIEGLTPKDLDWYSEYRPLDIKTLTIEDLDSTRMLQQEVAHLINLLSPDEQNEIKQKYAKDYGTDIHQIMAGHSDATIIDASFDLNKLDAADKELFYKALRALVIPVSEGSPVDFGEKNSTMQFVRVIQKQDVRALTLDDIDAIAAEAGLDKETARQIGSAFNSLTYSHTSLSYLANLLVKSSDTIVTKLLPVGGETKPVPINLEYVQRLFRLAHIVGIKQTLDSTTINRRITSVSYFDLEKVNSERHIEAEKAETQRKLGAIASAFESPAHNETNDEPELIRRLRDAHATPKSLVEAAMKVGKYENIYNADTGNWEKFTLGEHTETVLRNFDENFADNLPVNLLAPVQLAIIAHDLGKPEAAANGEIYNQKKYNLVQAAKFFDEIGLPTATSDFLLTIIGDGEELVSQSELRGSERAMAELRLLGESSLRNLLGTDEVMTDDQIDGYVELCKILFVCDGGAYTNMATTRRQGTGNFRNAPSFNNSFEVPIGFGKRTLKLKKRPPGY